MRARRLVARAGVTVVAVLGALIVLHAVMFHLPGDPVRVLFGFRSPGAEVVAELRASAGLDDPYLVQLGRYLRGLVTGDLGPVYRLGLNGLVRTGDVGDLIRTAMPSTLRLVAVAVVLNLVVGTALTALSAQLSGLRRVLVTMGVAVLIAVPSYAVASLLTAWAAGLVASANLLIGAAALAAPAAGITALVGRPLVVEATHAGYARRAVASGVGPRRVVWLHTLRPGLGTVVTLVAAETGAMLAATVLIEPVIRRPGVGTLLVRAINFHQGEVAVAIVGTFVIAMGLTTLVADVLQSWLDPRVDAV